MPDVAIIVPVFNRADQVIRAVNSVLAQSFQSFELIVVDDASTDDLNRVRQLVEDSGHQWKRLPSNQGPAAARNEGVRLSSSKWLSFLDSDDEWASQKLTSQWEWHRDNPAFSISQVNEAWFRNGVSFSKPGHLKQGNGDLFEASCQRCAIGPSCVMMTREIWDESGGFDERFRVCEDYALWLRIASKYRAGLVPGEPLVKKHGGHSDQLSVETPLLERYRFLALLEWIQANPGERERIETARRSLLDFGDQLYRYGKKHAIAEWADFFERTELSGEVDPAVIENAWFILHLNWSNPFEAGI
ncbi:glycosyltransferase family 2 protein [Verrucomicrobiales bacterium]|nr:glycosyltransferase family 2 protein [Verrucomicrobiales bacterium]